MPPGNWNDELLDKVDVIDMLEAGAHVRNLQLSGDEANFSCPFPGHSHGDLSPSAYMNVDSKLYYCHGCHKSGDAITFLADLEGVSIMRVVQWYGERYGEGFKEPKGSVLDEVIRRSRSPQQQKPLSRKDPELLQAELDDRVASWEFGSQGYVKYMLDRGFTAETLDDWEVGYDAKSDRIALAVRDVAGKLVGFKARAWRPDHEPRYLPLGDTVRTGVVYGFGPYRPGEHLYGLHRQQGDRLVVCEGEMNAIALSQVGIEAVAPAGSMISAKQLKLIRDSCELAVLVFDDDDAGREGQAKAVQGLEQFVPTLIAPPHREDPSALLQQGKTDEMFRLVEDARSRIELEFWGW